MKYSWDEEKNKINFKKHGVRFEEAQVIWTDPNSLEFFDPDHSKDEDRFIRIGINPKRGILFVAFCEREQGNIIRIISARKATKTEKGDYERELQS
jgi:hypothetical protein